jgi:hypothetical protein
MEQGDLFRDHTAPLEKRSRSSHRTKLERQKLISLRLKKTMDIDELCDAALRAHAKQWYDQYHMICGMVLDKLGAPYTMVDAYRKIDKRRPPGEKCFAYEQETIVDDRIT